MSHLKTSFNQILETRKKDLQKSMSKRPLSNIKNGLKDVDEPKNFKIALKNNKRFPLIVEYKPASPSMGDISSRGLEETIKLFKSGGASAISVLTEEKFFKGNIEYLAQSSKLTDIPIMRKDFIIDEYQIFESRLYGASSLLLMSDVYPDISSGIEICRSLGMEPLVECKNSIDIFKAIDADAEIIGINNRSFNDFTIDLNRTKSLAPLIPEDIVLVSESGVKNRGDVKTLLKNGADALLVGTSIMQSPDIVQTIKKFILTAETTLKSHNNPNSRFKARIRSKNRKQGDGSFEQFA